MQSEGAVEATAEPHFTSASDAERTQGDCLSGCKAKEVSPRVGRMQSNTTGEQRGSDVLSDRRRNETGKARGTVRQYRGVRRMEGREEEEDQGLQEEICRAVEGGRGRGEEGRRNETGATCALGTERET